MMRIVTGTAKGIRLNTLEGVETRPTSERVKEAVFSSIQFELAGKRVLDLFAGSGQLGLEAMSRGASAAMFIDASPDAMAVIKENAKKTGFFERCRYLISDYRSYIRKAGGRDLWDIIFIDPPYKLHLVGDALDRILKAGIAAKDSLIICESEEADIFAEREELKGHFDILKQGKYGLAHITILRYKGGEEIA